MTVGMTPLRHIVPLQESHSRQASMLVTATAAPSAGSVGVAKGGRIWRQGLPPELEVGLRRCL